ncbi:MAG: SO2930 family diheme c-type cytochrome [Steroidobacteraceae bacterium]
MPRLVTLLLALVGLVSCGHPTPEIRSLDPAHPPERLSDWGIAFVAGGELRVHAQALVYDLNTPLFSDYAAKQRAVWIPDGLQARVLVDGRLEFPVGTVISKTFYYPLALDEQGTGRIRVARSTGGGTAAGIDLDTHLPVETRLLVRSEDGWHALGYTWDLARGEAFLSPAGAMIPLELAGPDGGQAFTYVVPDANQCSGCHRPEHGGELQPLGPRDWQLSDWSAWQARGFLDPTAHLSRTPVRWDEAATFPLEQRARAYLDANCAHCHNPSGPADTSGLHLGLDQPLDRHTGLCKPPVAVGRGSGNRPYDITPGRPAESIMVYRMRHNDPAIAMPELGRSVVHEEGSALVESWIASLPGNC